MLKFAFLMYVSVPFGGFLWEFFLMTSLEERDLVKFNQQIGSDHQNSMISEQTNNELIKKYGPRFGFWLLDKMGTKAMKQKFLNQLMMRFKGFSRTGMMLLVVQSRAILPIRTFDSMLSRELEAQQLRIKCVFVYFSKNQQCFQNFNLNQLR
jgi:hypothetical protein